jgi:hypothetical protein
VVEGLSRALMEFRRGGSFIGIKIRHNLFLLHILFVDDILLFCDGMRWVYRNLKEILDLYCTTIGILVNIQIYFIFYYGLNKEDIKIFSRLFPF